ncbi:MAG: hypothetical protein RLZZ84_633 [Pseudomonadota bacterium]|jgi:hypothetical protein
MSDTKTFASLGPSLLARKGSARPAMRPQLAAVLPIQLNASPDDDLGWNDMGDDAAAAPPPSVPASHQPSAPVRSILRVPPVVAQQQDLSRRIGGGRRSALADGRRCAFTLRVDAQRHLKLRLACTLHNRSAQQLITEALDLLLADLPDLAELADQVAGKVRT